MDVCAMARGPVRWPYRVDVIAIVGSRRKPRWRGERDGKDGSALRQPSCRLDDVARRRRLPRLHSASRGKVHVSLLEYAKHLVWLQHRLRSEQSSLSAPGKFCIVWRL